MKMSKTSLILTTTDILGRKQQQSITDVNPNADTTALKTFAQMCNALTTDTYVSTDRIDKINCDLEAGTSKTTPTFSASKTTFSKALAGQDATSTDDGMIYNSRWTVQTTVTYNGDGVLYASVNNAIDTFTVTYSSANTYTVKAITSTSTTLPQTITIHTTETDTYKAATPITLTLTA